MKKTIIRGSFDNIKSYDIRFLEEAAKFGSLHVLLWSDAFIRQTENRAPKFPQEERQYFLEAVRYVSQVTLVNDVQNQNELSLPDGGKPEIWVVAELEDTPEKRLYCQAQGIEYRVVGQEYLNSYPIPQAENQPSANKKVLVTGCFDWFHSGHVRFFEETSQLGDLYVVVGHDKNVRLLKGEGHPMYSEDERRYMAGSIRFVKQALISSGSGWMDAEPEIAMIRPDIYAVNEDGDKPEKRKFCEQYGLEYVVLRRTPAAGLPERTSTNLRGF